MAITLRPYQVELKQAIYDAWNAGYKNVLAVKPTGMGKTKTFCSITMDKAIDPGGPRLPTAIMVHRKELVQQISLTLAEEEVPHNIIAPRNVILGIVAAQRRVLGRQFYDYNAPVTVVSVDTLNARIDKHRTWANSIRLWITDEAAHLLKNNKWGRAVAQFPNAIGLGVTATPRRLDKKGLGTHADGVFDTMVEGPTSRWGMDQGFLCRYKIAVPDSDYQRFLKKASDGADFSKEAMITASNQSHIVGDVVANYRKFADGKQAILFASDIGTGKRMEQAFREQGVTAKLLTGDSEDKDRLDSLIAFQEKKIKVLLNVDLFDEGLDVPGIECVIMARPTMSLGKYLQMVGRGLRPAKGKEFLVLIDHVGNVTTHGLPCARRVWSLDRVVRRRENLNLLRICSNVSCNVPYDRALTECPWCGFEAIPQGGGGGGGKPTLQQVDGDLFLMDPETLRNLEQAVQLEDPASVGKRVSLAAGGNAAIKAIAAQRERIETQKDLANVIAKWAGKMRAWGYGDRQIHKRFYLHYGQTITEALSEPRAAMLSTIESINSEL